MKKDINHIIAEEINRFLVNEEVNSNGVLDMIFIAYGTDEFEKEKSRQVGKNRNWEIIHNKPNGGIWASPLNSKWGWGDWCSAENFRLDSLDTHYLFKLSPEAKIYVIDNLKDLFNISSKHGNYFGMGRTMDFDKLESEYDGVYVTANAASQFHYNSDNSGYLADLNSWDVESICIFNPNIIIPIKENDFDKLKTPFYFDGDTRDDEDDWGHRGSINKDMQMKRDYKKYGNTNTDGGYTPFKGKHPALVAQGDENDPETLLARKYNGTLKSGL